MSKNKLISILAAIGITAGGYLIGSIDTIECLVSDHQIDVGEVRLCLSDEQYALVKNSDLADLIEGDLQVDHFDQVVAIADKDNAFYVDVERELVKKVNTNKNTGDLFDLHKKLMKERPEYATVLLNELVLKLNEDNSLDIDNFPLYTEAFNEAIKAEGSVVLQNVTFNNLMTKLYEALIP